MPATKKGKQYMKVRQVDGSKKMHMLWSVKKCSKCESLLTNLQTLQESKISSDHKNNIMVQTTNDNVILDSQVKTHDGWLAKVNL